MNLQRNIILGYITSGLTSLYFFFPIWYEYESGFIRPELLIIMYAVMYGVTVILEIPTGALADLIGRKTTVLSGYALQAVAYLTMGMARDAAWIWVGYFLFNVGEALISGAKTALMYDTYKEIGRENEYASYSATSSLILRIGIVASSAIGGYIFLLRHGAPYIMTGVLFGSACIITYFMKEPSIDSEKFSWNGYVAQTKEGIKELLKNTTIRITSLYYLVIGGLTWYYLYYLFTAYITERDFSAISRGWISSGISITIGIVLFVITKKIKLSTAFLIYAFPICMSIGYLPAAIAPIWLVPVLAFFPYVAGAGRHIFLDQMINDMVVSKNRATALSVLNMGVGIVFIILSFGQSLLRVEKPTLIMMTTLGMLTVVVAFPITYMLHRQMRREKKRI
jgi:MFS family permease